MDAFRASLYRHLAHCWTNDRSEAGYLAKQYGLQTATKNTPEWMQPGLRIANPLSSKYQQLQAGYVHRIKPF